MVRIFSVLQYYGRDCLLLGLGEGGGSTLLVFLGLGAGSLGFPGGLFGTRSRLGSLRSIGVRSRA
jgi:hypothetical protein